MVKMNKKANAAKAWILAIASIFIVGVVYVALAEPWETIKNLLVSGVGASYVATFTKIDNAWKVVPILVIFGVIIGAIAMSIRGNQDPYNGM